MQFTKKTLLALLPYFLQAQAGASGAGTTTRYWDCCKPSCAWSGKTALISGSTSVMSCDINDNPLTNANTGSGCGGGDAYMCSSESPWGVTDDLAYGYAAVNIAGGSEESWCCACYELTFTSGAIAGKKMIVQATNTGGDLGTNQFDISVPGGGVGLFNGCTAEWGAPSAGWGAQYGGISSRSDCDSFPKALQAGCYWRFDWFQGSDNPTVSFTQVACPAAITKKTGCIRADDTSEPVASAPSGSTVVTTSSADPVPSSPSVNPSTSSTSSNPVSTSKPAASAPSGSTVVTTSSADPVSLSLTVDPSTSFTGSEPISTSAVGGGTTSEASVTYATTAATEPTPTPVTSADPATSSAIDDDVCEL